MLGDSGYPCKRFLMTMFLNHANAAEQRFNDALYSARVLVEQTVGVLKRRIQWLHHEIEMSSPLAAVYVVGCVVIYNIGINRGIFCQIKMMMARGLLGEMTGCLWGKTQ